MNRPGYHNTPREQYIADNTPKENRMEWQQIKTAPKGSSRIRNNEGPRILAFVPSQNSKVGIVYFLWDKYADNKDGGWWVYDDEILADSSPEIHPTHWMPLPAAPVQS